MQRRGRAVVRDRHGKDITSRKRAEDEVRFLANASGVLASSLDYQTTLTNLARIAVPTLADWCVVDVVNDGISRVAAEHSDPTKAATLRELTRRYPPDWRSPQPAAGALRTGKPELISEVSDSVLHDRTIDTEHRKLIQEMGSGSFIAVPLTAREHVLGVISLISATHRYDTDHLELSVELGRRAAVAIDNSRLYEEALAANKAKSDFLSVMSHELQPVSFRHSPA